MNLWIRSQDKTTLIRSYEIYIAEYGKDSYVIRAKRTSHILGAYKSMKRALEVLDEIQNLLKPQMKVITHSIEEYKLKDFSKDIILQPMVNELKFREASTWVYEMPSE